MSVQSFDPSEDPEYAAEAAAYTAYGEDAPPLRPAGRGTGKKKPTQRRSGPKKPRNWLPTSAREEDPENPDHEPQPLTDEQARKLRERSMNLCLWHLGQGPRTRKQLVDAMAKHMVPEDIRESVLAQLEEYDYVNDETFAENYVRSRTEFQRKGSLAIRHELRRKGVADEAIAAALDEVDEDTELANARILVEKKLRTTRGLDRAKRTNRLVGMLARKGYHGGIAYQVVREAIEAEEPDEDFDPR